MSELLSDVDDLEKYFPAKSGIIKRTSDYMKAVDGVSFDIERGETLTLIGKSGPSKSTVTRTIIDLTGATGRTVRFNDEDTTNVADEQLVRLRSRAQMVSQDLTSSLNPRQTIGKSLAVPLGARGMATSDLRERVVDLLERVELNDEYWNKYPHEFSGGQKQWVNIARAFAVEPELLLLDEPTSTPDASVQAEIIALLEDLQAEFGLTYLFTTHDLSLVRSFADETAVMYLGEIQERDPTQEVFQRPRHPYSRTFLSAIPVTTDEEEAYKPRHELFQGEISSPWDVPTGRRFHTWCPYATDACSTNKSAFVAVDAGPSVRYHIYDEVYADAFGDVSEVAVTAVADEGVTSNQEP